jgi:Bacterial PH domain
MADDLDRLSLLQIALLHILVIILVLPLPVCARCCLRHDLSNVRKGAASRNPANGPALSLDRLQVDYVRGGVERFILISPKDKLGFLSDLAQKGVDLKKLDGQA